MAVRGCGLVKELCGNVSQIKISLKGKVNSIVSYMIMDHYALVVFWACCCSAAARATVSCCACWTTCT